MRICAPYEMVNNVGVLHHCFTFTVAGEANLTSHDRPQHRLTAGFRVLKGQRFVFKQQAMSCRITHRDIVLEFRSVDNSACIHNHTTEQNHRTHAAARTHNRCSIHHKHKPDECYLQPLPRSDLAFLILLQLAPFLTPQNHRKNTRNAPKGERRCTKRDAKARHAACHASTHATMRRRQSPGLLL